MTTQGEELNKLKENGVVIHTFYLGKAQQNFRKISEQTGGDSIKFPNGRRDASDILSNVIAKNTMKIGDKKLDAIGIKNAGLQVEFEKRYT